MKRKFVFIGDTDSINLELVYNSFTYIKDKVEYILIGNIKDAIRYLNKIQSKININEIYNPIEFQNYNPNNLNFYNIDNVSKKKFKNLINQIKISNFLSKTSGYDLVTLPINKSLFKKEMEFIGMTEYLGFINKKNTFMLMHGDKFSAIPLTTHVNLNDVKNFLNRRFINNSLNEIIKQINRKIYRLNIKSIKFLCYNPHCGESETIGNEDKIISDCISNFKKILGPYSADSAFRQLDNCNSLFISMYHDQALIPFKIINKKSINFTMGLDYRRLSPTHGTANNIKYKNIANISSYLACMEY